MADLNQQNLGVPTVPSTTKTVSNTKTVCPTQTHIDSLREYFAHLESELQLAAERHHAPPRHCQRRVAFYALKVGCDLFKLVDTPQEPLLAESERVLKLGVPILRLTEALSNIPEAKEKELAGRKPDWALPAGLVVKYLYDTDTYGDITLVKTPPRTTEYEYTLSALAGKHTPTPVASTSAQDALGSAFVLADKENKEAKETKKNCKNRTPEDRDFLVDMPNKKIKMEF